MTATESDLIETNTRAVTSLTELQYKAHFKMSSHNR